MKNSQGVSLLSPSWSCRWDPGLQTHLGASPREDAWSLSQLYPKANKIRDRLTQWRRFTSDVILGLCVSSQCQSQRCPDLPQGRGTGEGKWRGRAHRYFQVSVPGELRGTGGTGEHPRTSRIEGYVNNGSWFLSLSRSKRPEWCHGINSILGQSL